MARPRQFQTPAEKQKAYRERKQMPAAEVDPELPERDIEEPEALSTDRPVEVLLTLPPTAPLTDFEERSLRDHFGYTASERRTRAERSATAARISAALGPPTPETTQAIRLLQDEEKRLAQRQASYLASLKT